MTTVPLEVTQPAQWQTRVQLRSNDGQRYEIDRQILINRSGFFANLFQVPRPVLKEVNVATGSTVPPNAPFDFENEKHAVTAPTSTTDEDIDIDLPFNDLVLLADFMQLTNQFKHFVRSANLELDISQAGVLLPLIDKFDCEFMRAILKVRLGSLAKTQPWEVLHLACKHDDLDMARMAISNLTSSAIHKPLVTALDDTTIWTQLSMLTPAWQLEFLRLYIIGTHGSRYSTPTGNLNDKFAIWAKDFDPKKYQEAEGVDGKRKRI